MCSGALCANVSCEYRKTALPSWHRNDEQEQDCRYQSSPEGAAFGNWWWWWWLLLLSLIHDSCWSSTMEASSSVNTAFSELTIPLGNILGYFSGVGSAGSESIGSRRVSTKLFGDLQRFEMILVAPNLLLPDLQRGQADPWLHPAAQSLDAHGRPARFLPPSRVQFQKPCPNLREVMIPMIHHGFRSISIVVHDDWMITRGTPMTKRKAPIENQCPVMKCTEVNNRLTCFERGLSQPSQNFCETCETTKQKSVDIPSFSGSPFWEELQLLSNCWSLHCHHQ